MNSIGSLGCTQGREWVTTIRLPFSQRTRLEERFAPILDEVIDLGWFTRDALPEELLLWGQRERITDVFDGVGGSVVRTRNWGAS